MNTSAPDGAEVGNEIVQFTVLGVRDVFSAHTFVVHKDVEQPAGELRRLGRVVFVVPISWRASTG
jgi:hypothetical protein